MTINRREFINACAVGVSITALDLAGAADLSAKKKPNIVLCMADDQGWGDMAYNGHPVLQTPCFDNMAVSGLRFDRFYAAAPVCSPTRGSVMTGRHPNRFGCFKWGYTLRPQETTVAEALKTAGYTTGHFGKWHLGPVLKDSPVNPGASGFDEWFSSPNFFDNDPILSREGKAVRTQGESSMVTVDAAIQFIREQSKSKKPFLAVVWFGSPHNPHQALKEDRELYKDEEEKFQHFYGEITAMDRAFGKLRGELKTLGIRDNTILWYCSDNGGLPELSRTGGRGHKAGIYEGGLRVPAMLEWPTRIPKHRVTAVPCNTSDIYPTLLDVACVMVENQTPLDGISLFPIIKNWTEKRLKPMGFWDYPIKGISTPSKTLMEELLETQKSGKEITSATSLCSDTGTIVEPYPEDTFPGHAAWLDWPWKLHRIQNEKGGVKYELYNLEKDPMEEKDFITRNPERVRLMKPALEQWQVSVVRSLNGKDY